MAIRSTIQALRLEATESGHNSWNPNVFTLIAYGDGSIELGMEVPDHQVTGNETTTHTISLNGEDAEAFRDVLRRM